MEQAALPSVVTDVSFLYGKAFDFGPAHQMLVKRNYVIATTPRSGSTYLSHLLYHVHGLGLPLEYFHLDNAYAPVGIADDAMILNHCDEIARRRRDPATGIFGVKCFATDAIRLKALSPTAFATYLLGATIIRLIRRDLLAQAVSLARARQTGRWFSNRLEKRTPQYNYDDIADAAHFIRKQNAWWNRFIGDHHFPVLTIEYTEREFNPVDVADEVAALFSISVSRRSTGVRLPDSQRDETSQQWIRRFLDEDPDRMRIFPDCP